MIFLGLGTNIGARAANMRQAYEELTSQGVEIVRRSNLYQSPPWGITDQAAFLNAVCEVKFEGQPKELLAICLETEARMGRKRVQKWGPRLIDIDVLEFNRMQQEDTYLTLPHPFYTKRDFVLVPLAELEPDWVPTGQKKPVSQLVSLDHQIIPYFPS